ncbi:MAG TPA: type II toxin-antitoxin system prevent-host-death family antitoxin [Telluria sp.]|nr:type II toxin-antitoxin system prevent-host-death family antitoxin [Telluria sp.]
MKIVSFSDARNNLRAVIDQVVDDADVTVIARRDAPDAVIMSFDYYTSLMETVHLLNSPANAAHLAKSLAQARSGQAQRRELSDSADAEGSHDAKPEIHG